MMASQPYNQTGEAPFAILLRGHDPHEAVPVVCGPAANPCLRPTPQTGHAASEFLP